MERKEAQQQWGVERFGIVVWPDALWEDVTALAGDIGERNLRDATRLQRLRLARDYLVERLEGAGCPVRLHRYEVAGLRVENLEVELLGASRPGEVVVVGAHYDSARGSPGGNDNATGVATLLALAGALHGGRIPRPARTVRFVAFATGEPPHTRTPQMGSFLYARRCSERRELVRAMLSLESLGCYAHGDRWPEAPFPLNVVAPFPADFFAVVGNLSSRALVRRCTQAFPSHLGVSCRGVALPGALPGVKGSDHWSFWQHGYPAVMVTDTAFLRSRHSHRPTDVPERVDFASLAAVATGLLSVVRALASDAAR